MAVPRLPYVISLNCLEQFTKETAAALADVCVFEHVGLVEGMLETISIASIVILPSIQYLPRAAQRKLSPSQLLLCIGAGSDMRAVESSVAEELGLRLFHVDIPRADEIADTVMGLMLGLSRRTHILAIQGCTSASWHGGFRDAWAGMRRLKGLTLGLVGVNAAGRAVARRAAAFGMKIVYCDLESELLGADVMEAKRKGKIRKALQAVGTGMMTLRQTVEHADIVSLHCSLKDDTLHLINDKSISYFKRGSVLVNASSCHLVSDSALKRALQSGLLSCCALDGVEGPQWMEAWVKEFPNVLILPRSADQSSEAWAELNAKVVQVLRTFLLEGRVPHDAVVIEDIAQEEADWAAMGLPAQPPAPAATPARSPASSVSMSAVGTSSSATPSAAAAGGKAAAAKASGGAKAGGHAKDGKVSFGGVRVEVIERDLVPTEAEESLEDDIDDDHVCLGAWDTDRSLYSESGGIALPYGSLIALRSVEKPGLYLSAERAPFGSAASFVLALKPKELTGPSNAAAQFVVYIENDVMGCRSVFADGKYLQANEKGELVFANQHFDQPESWHLELSSETKRAKFTNAANSKVAFEAIVELLT